MRAGPGHSQLLRDMRDRTPGQHSLHQDQTTRFREPGITVNQEKAFLE
jgi:hypothetical protein